MTPVKLLLQLLPKAVPPAILVAEIEAVEPETPPVEAVDTATVVAELGTPIVAELETVPAADTPLTPLTVAPLITTGLAVVGVLAGLN